MWIELIGHTTYLLLTLSYLVRDIVWLRLISIPASVCSIAYCYWGADEPVWLIIRWNIAFLVVNLYQLCMIHVSNYRIQKTPNMARFANLVGQGIKPTEAAQLFRCGRFTHCKAGQMLLTEGQHADNLYFLWEGEAEILLGGKVVGDCRTGTFLGEIGYLTEQSASASIRIAADSTLLRWDRALLAKSLSCSPALKTAFLRHLATDLRAKLQQRESQLAALEVAEMEPQPTVCG